MRSLSRKTKSSRSWKRGESKASALIFESGYGSRPRCQHASVKQASTSRVTIFRKNAILIYPIREYRIPKMKNRKGTKWDCCPIRPSPCTNYAIKNTKPNRSIIGPSKNKFCKRILPTLWRNLDIALHCIDMASLLHYSRDICVHSFIVSLL
jgi:hypothetical protein